MLGLITNDGKLTSSRAYSYRIKNKVFKTSTSTNNPTEQVFIPTSERTPKTPRDEGTDFALQTARLSRGSVYDHVKIAVPSPV